METKLKTGPSVEPVSLEDLKGYLHVEDNDQDNYLNLLIESVRSFVEGELNRRLITQTWYLYMEDWPIIEEYFEVPYGNLQSVASIKYKGTGGDELTWGADNYIVATGYEVGRIVLGYNKSWPTSVLYPSLPITVEFTCGYGGAGKNVVPSIVGGMKQIMADMFWKREIKPSSNIWSSLTGELLLKNKLWWVY